MREMNWHTLAQNEAAAVQVCSALYENDFTYLGQMLEQVGDWMNRKDFASVAEFRGRLSQRASENPASYERVQFMRYYGGKKNVVL